MSFLDLPGEIRNYIYNLLIPDTSKYYTEVVDLDPNLPRTLPVVAFIFTCKEFQRELLPLYLRTINLRLQYKDPPWPAQCLDRNTSKLMKAYEAMNPIMVDHLHSLRLDSSIVRCVIQVTDSRAVHVELFYEAFWIPSKALSIEIRDHIVDSLTNSSTGLLGIGHFAIAFQTLLQIHEWFQWLDEDEEWEMMKLREAPWHPSIWCRCCAPYKRYLVKQAEAEGMPRLISATTSLQDEDKLYDWYSYTCGGMRKEFEE